MSSTEHTITIDGSGDLQFVYADDLQPLTELGESTTRRASHVEPAGSRWTADLSPVDGPVLGPFDYRKEALAAEYEWLRANGY